MRWAILVALLTTGCPDPDRLIYFGERDHWTQDREIDLFDQRLRMRIGGTSDFMGLYERYRLDVFVEVWPHDRNMRPKFSPDSIGVWFEELPMTVVAVENEYYKNGKELFVVTFECDHRGVALKPDSEGRIREATIRIYLGDFVMLGDQKPTVDTLMAVERKVRRYQDTPGRSRSHR